MASTRWLVKRDLEQCMIRLNGIQTYLARCGMLYEPEHPKIYELFCALMMITDTLEQGLKDLRGHI